MANKPKKKPIEKKSFDLDAFKKTEGLDNIIKEKELAWIPLSEEWKSTILM